MNPTIALWYKRKHQGRIGGKPPNLEVHINLWRHHSSKEDFNLLDIGIRVLDPHDLGQLILFIPVDPDRCEIQDLGLVLRDPDTLSAVFNEILSISACDESTKSFEVQRQKKDYLTVHPCEIGQDVKVDKKNGYLLTFAPEFCRRLSFPGEHYIRLRFRMLNGAESAFSKETTSEDGFLLSSVAISEITELRFNEARSLPGELLTESEIGGWLTPRIEALHYFLVRDAGFDLVASHANFKKMRRLEDKIWEGYLSGAMPKKAAEKMIIYHWRSTSSQAASVSDVVTLAKFRRSRANILVYILAVVALGAMGSALHSSLVSWLDGRPLWPHFLSILILFSVAFALTLCSTGWIKRVWKTARAQLSK